MIDLSDVKGKICLTYVQVIADNGELDGEVLEGELSEGGSRLSASQNHGRLAQTWSFYEEFVRVCRGRVDECQCSDSSDPSCAD